jgi:glucose-1-phosphate cytidylyltransferase
MPSPSLPDLPDLPVVILCGGEGTRFYDPTRERPKPLAEIGDRPILYHLMQLYAAQGHRRFILCLGYKGEMVEAFFRDPRVAERTADWRIHFADTGRHAMTGARVKRVQSLIDAEHFMLTYGDGLADIDLAALLAFHAAHGGIGTVTGVQPHSQFGELAIDGDLVRGFAEKPKVSSVINGGFFVFRRAFLDYLDDDDACVLEREPMIRLCGDGGLRVFRHHGFWQCMDTFKDYRLLNELWLSGAPPWVRGP